MKEFTDGDMSLIPKLVKLAENIDGGNAEQKWKKKQEIANSFIEPALEIYFTNLGINPFEGIEI